MYSSRTSDMTKIRAALDMVILQLQPYLHLRYVLQWQVALIRCLEKNTTKQHNITHTHDDQLARGEILTPQVDPV